MNEVLVTEQWFQTLVDDCVTIAVERGFRSRLETIEGYYEIGKRILQDNANFERAKIYRERLVATVAESLKLSERSIYYAIKIAETTDNFEQWINTLPEGKNLSWHTLCQKYLTQPKAETKALVEPKGVEEYLLCKSCGGDNPLEMTCKRCKGDFEFEAKDILKR